MTKYLILYIACAIPFFSADFIWLTLTATKFYRANLGDLMLEKPNLAVAAGFYLAYVAGLVILVAAPAEGDIVKALWMGAVLGFVAYGTYDLTNLSTMRGFSSAVAIVDIAWGTLLSAATAAIGVWIAGFFV